LRRALIYRSTGGQRADHALPIRQIIALSKQAFFDPCGLGLLAMVLA
jgi:hypothetical protein